MWIKRACGGSSARSTRATSLPRSALGRVLAERGRPVWRDAAVGRAHRAAREAVLSVLRRGLRRGIVRFYGSNDRTALSDIVDALIGLPAGTSVWIAAGVTAMRRGADGRRRCRADGYTVAARANSNRSNPCRIASSKCRSSHGLCMKRKTEPKLIAEVTVSTSA